MFQNKRKIIVLELLSYQVSYMIYMWLGLYGYIIKPIKLKMTQSKTISLAIFSCFLMKRYKLQRKNVWLYINEVLDIVDEFNYLGMMFNYNGKFSKTQ